MLLCKGLVPLSVIEAEAHRGRHYGAQAALSFDTAGFERA